MRTGLAYSPAFLAHETPAGHPERPARLTAIVQQLHDSGAWSRCEVWEPAALEAATLELVHSPAHIAFIRSLVARGGGRIDADTGVSPGSWDAALRAAGAVVEAADRVTSDQLDNAFCLVRPPGHHATPTQAMGFCLFNSVAVAAAWLLASGRARRVAILDYDVHHGNGTQDAFYDRADVLYLSTHQFPLYPGTGHWRETGAGAGEGTTMNLALPPGSGDEIFAALRTRLIEPAVRRFDPDVVLVSLGFDAFWNDPLASLRLSIAGAFVPLLRSAYALGSGRLIVALEGGYDLRALAHGAEAVTRILLDDDVPPDPLGPPPEQLPFGQVEVLLDAIAQLHRLD